MRLMHAMISLPNEKLYSLVVLNALVNSQRALFKRNFELNKKKYILFPANIFFLSSSISLNKRKKYGGEYWFLVMPFSTLNRLTQSVASNKHSPHICSSESHIAWILFIYIFAGSNICLQWKMLCNCKTACKTFFIVGIFSLVCLAQFRLLLWDGLRNRTKKRHSDFVFLYFHLFHCLAWIQFTFIIWECVHEMWHLL